MKTKGLTRRSKLTELPAKLCNICGNETVVYIVDRNAPICENCKPLNKIIPNDKKMVENILMTTQQQLLK